MPPWVLGDCQASAGVVMIVVLLDPDFGLWERIQAIGVVCVPIAWGDDHGGDVSGFTADLRDASEGLTKFFTPSNCLKNARDKIRESTRILRNYPFMTRQMVNSDIELARQDTTPLDQTGDGKCGMVGRNEWRNIVL